MINFFHKIFLLFFKDFLQNIEGSLMTSKLYDEWIAVTKKVDDEEKLAAVQR